MDRLDEVIELESPAASALPQGDAIARQTGDRRFSEPCDAQIGAVQRHAVTLIHPRLAAQQECLQARPGESG